jgi:hypothetical protein
MGFDLRAARILKPHPGGKRVSPLRRQSRLLVAAVSLAIATSWALPLRALAQSSCSDPEVANRHDGIYTNYSPVYSARGSIFDMLLPLCSPSDGTSSPSAWVMVAGGGAHEYVQIGFARQPGMASPMRFTETSDGDGNVDLDFYPGFWSNGTNHFYEVLFDFSGPPRYFTLKADGQVFNHETDWSPEGGEWTVGWKAQFFGETWDRGDDMPGTSTNHEHFTNVKVIKTWGGGWVVPPNPFHPSTLSYYKFAWVTQPNYFDIWTER